jgi:hypothetical protein
MHPRQSPGSLGSVWLFSASRRTPFADINQKRELLVLWLAPLLAYLCGGGVNGAAILTPETLVAGEKPSSKGDHAAPIISDRAAIVNCGALTPES